LLRVVIEASMVGVSLLQADISDKTTTSVVLSKLRVFMPSAITSIDVKVDRLLKVESEQAAVSATVTVKLEMIRVRETVGVEISKVIRSKVSALAKVGGMKAEAVFVHWILSPLTTM